jgi:dynein heavy chain
MDKFYSFLSSTTILNGQIKGETRLPMPPMDQGPSQGKNRISLLEGAIITWTKQIKGVLKQDPESQLKQVSLPLRALTPLREACCVVIYVSCPFF